jgi:hypothetical protein
MQRLPNSEREISTFAAEVGLPNFSPKAGSGQVHSNEINEYAYERLDEAVFAAYGWPPDLSDEEVHQTCSSST